MKNYAFVLALLLALWPLASHGADYAALEGKEFYAGGILLSFFGENPAGESARESFIGVSAGGLTEDLSWQAFMGCSWDDDGRILGGSADAILLDNFAECSQGCENEPMSLWWLGAGGTVIVYEDLFDTVSGSSVSGEELGINVGAGYYWHEYVANFYIHHFLDSGSSMLSADVMRAF